MTGSAGSAGSSLGVVCESGQMNGGVPVESGVTGLELVFGSASVNSLDILVGEPRFSSDGAGSSAMCVGLTSAVAGLEVGEPEELLVGVETVLVKVTGLSTGSVGLKLVSSAAVVLGGTGPRQEGRSWCV